MERRAKERANAQGNAESMTGRTTPRRATSRDDGDVAKASLDEQWNEGKRASTSTSAIAVRGFVDNRPKDARDVERARGAYVAPSVEEARAHGDATAPRHLNDNGQLEKFSVRDESLDLGVEFSAGLSGYFFVVKCLAVLFLAAFALNVPVMFVNYTSTYYASEYEADPTSGAVPIIEPGRPSPTFQSWYVNWHWANPQSASLGTAAPDSVPQHVWLNAGVNSGVMRWSMSKISFLRFGVLMDVMTVVMFGIAAPTIIYVMNRADAAITRGTVTLNDYTVMVTRLPADATEEEVRCFFALKYGVVADVTLIKNECLHANKQRARLALMEDYDECEAALIANGNRGKDGRKDGIEKRIIEIDKKLARMKSSTRCKRVTAFVTFESEDAKIECLLRNRRNWFRHIFAFPRNERFRTKIRFIARASPEPADVKFENLNLSNQFWRTLLVGLIIIGVVFFCGLFLRLLVDSKEKRWHTASMNPDRLAMDVGIVISHERGDLVRFAQTSQFKNACKDLLDTCGEAFSGGTRYAGVPWGAPALVFYSDGNATEEDRAFAQVTFVRNMRLCSEEPTRCPMSLEMSKCYACHCASQSYSLPHEVLRLYNKPVRDACDPYVENGPGEYYHWLWNAFCIMLMNHILTFLVPRLVAFERYKTFGETVERKAQLLFIVKYVNVAILYLALNANLKQIKKYLPVFSHIFRLDGEYPDFTSEWYNDVGLVIFFVILLSVMFGVIGRIFTDIHTIMKRKIGIAQAKTQKKLNAAFEGPDLDIGANCGDIAFKVLVVMTFSSGMPLLYLVLAMFFVLIFAYDYHLLLHVCRRPERTRLSVVKFVMRVLIFGVILHCLIGFWMWTYHWSPDVFKPKSMEESLVFRNTPLSYFVGGKDLNPPHNNTLLMEVVTATGTATEYMHKYHSENIGSVVDGDPVKGPPRMSVRFVERPWSETGMPFMVLMITVLGASILWWLFIKLTRWGMENKEIILARKNLPRLHDAINAGLLLGSLTYKPRMHRMYRFLFEENHKKAAASGSQVQHDGVKQPGDAANSHDEDFYDHDKPGEVDDDEAGAYNGGAPWANERDRSIFGGDSLNRRRGSRGTHQRDGGHGHAYNDGIAVDTRALGMATDFNHRNNNKFKDGVENSDYEYSDQGSEEGTLADDASTQPSEPNSDGEDEYVNDESRRPSWL